MYLRLLAPIGLAGLLLASPAFAAAPCCQEMKADKACCDMPCCKDHAGMDHAQMPMAEASAVDLFFQMEQPVPAVVTASARQATEVWFMQPVRVGDKILQGRYVIEHDNDRMARGEPCTHIYAFNDQKTPVVAFHCTHLERGAVKGNTVVLQPNADGFKTFTEFQFNGETAAHGYPTIR